jgi:hypothetical protein
MVGCAAWTTVTVRPAIETIPERAAPLLELTDRVTVPAPEPLVGDTLIHDAPLDALQLVEHAPFVATVTGIEAAASVSAGAVGETV